MHTNNSEIMKKKTASNSRECKSSPNGGGIIPPGGGGPLQPGGGGGNPPIPPIGGPWLGGMGMPGGGGGIRPGGGPPGGCCWFSVVPGPTHQWQDITVTRPPPQLQYNTPLHHNAGGCAQIGHNGLTVMLYVMIKVFRHQFVQVQVYKYLLTCMNTSLSHSTSAYIYIMS